MASYGGPTGMKNLDQSSPEGKAEQAFSAYQAILSQARADKTLIDSEKWNARATSAYAEFIAAYDAIP